MGYKYCSEGHIMDPSWKYCPVCLAPLAGWLLTLDKEGKAHKFYTIHEDSQGAGAFSQHSKILSGSCQG